MNGRGPISSIGSMSRALIGLIGSLVMESSKSTEFHMSQRSKASFMMQFLFIAYVADARKVGSAQVLQCVEITKHRSGYFCP